ncbi:MAG: PhoH family protein, partial [Elusimicrobiota bacterium]
MVTKRIELYGLEEALSLFGEYDRNLRYLENKYGVQIFARSNIVSIRGRSIKVENAYQAITEMREMLRANKNMAGFKLDPGIENKSIIPSNSTAQNQYLKNGNGTSQLSSIYVTYRGKPVIPQTLTQQSYTDKIAENDIVIAIGPAGTGKTFLAAAMALAAWEKGKVARIILTRPVVEAGEKLG